MPQTAPAPRTLDQITIPLRFVSAEEAVGALLDANLTREVEAIGPESKQCSGLCNMDSGICNGHPTGSLNAVTGFEEEEGTEPLYLYGEHAEARAKLLAMVPDLIYTLRWMQQQNQQLKDALRGEELVGDPTR